ncbi:MAG TPA: efflux RND transporter permease subunit [Caulobacteraceae bacterium]|nr:efflux RND transporter permease subunit [Caulobacteraceae bacterium]
MNVSELFIRRPVATILLTVGVALAGVAAFFLLPVSPLPQVDFPTIFVQANLPGASPETMATSVATPLERHLGIISDVSEITSQSRVSQTRIVLQFDLGRSIDGAARDVEAAINAARVDLPQTLRQNPTYRKVNPADAPIIVLALTSKTRTPGQIYDVADTVIQQQISQVKGVGNVTLGGSSLPAVRIELNPLELARDQIGLEDVRAALASANANQPKGVVQQNGLRYQIYTNDTGLAAADYAPLVIAYRNGNAVRLSDVARVIDGVEDVHNFGLFNGQPAIIVQVSRQPGANIIDATDRVKALIPTLEAALPPDIDWHIVTDRTISIRASLAEVERTVILSTILVVAVVAFFLRNGRAILIPSVAVVVSLLGALAVMYLLGFSLDNLSLMALTVATGFVVDDAIVVLENITRHVEAGMGRFEAALQGAKEVGFTVVSISISLVAVFLPILLMGGIVGRLFREFAATLSAAVLVSLVISLTTTPMMSAYLVDPPRRDRRPNPLSRFSEGLFSRMQRIYERALDWALDSGPVMLVVLFACIALTVFLFGVVQKGFFPIQDTGLIMGGLQTDQSSSFSLTAGRLRRLVNIIDHDPSVATVAAFAGSNAAGGFLITELKPRNERKGGSAEVVQRLRPKLARVIGASLFLNPAQDIRVGGRSSNATYQYTIEGQDLASVRLWAGRLSEALKRQPGMADVNTDQEDHGLESYVHIARGSSGRLHMTNVNIDNNLYDEFGQRQVSTIYKETNQYHIIMEADPQFTADPTALQYVYTSTGGAAASPVSPLVTTTAVGALGETTAMGAVSSASSVTGAPHVATAVGAAAAVTVSGAPTALAAIGSSGSASSATVVPGTSITTLGLTAAPGPTNPTANESSASVATTATAANAPAAANAAGVPGGVSASVGTDVAVGVAALAGPAAPPGRAASQGVAVSTTPEQVFPLATYAAWNDQATPTSVNHQDTQPATTISFNLGPGASLSDATAAMTRAAASIGMPANVHGSFQGTARVFQQSLADEPILILAALVAIYIVLGVLYESYIHPLTVLSTLPSAGTGALIALILFHIEFDIIGLIGLILLIGIVKKNAIMMIDFALDAEREQGLSPHASIRQAALTRFRPIMMTTFAAMLGALPLAIGWGEGSELRRPLGVTIIGGLLVSQLITLLTTPVVYLYLDRLHNWRRRGGSPRPAVAPQPSSA